MKAIQTEYRGYLFRSRLEARWAVFFDACGIRWEYEPEGIVLDDGSYYLPDFYLPDLYCFFEVKRKSIKGTDEEEEAIRKIRNGMDNDDWAGLICFGDPMDDDITVFCQETDDGGGGSYRAPVTIGICRCSGKPCLFSYGDRRDRLFLTSLCGDVQYIPMLTEEYGKYRYEDFITLRVLKARRLARQARFEHGEMPKAGRRI